MQTEILKKDVLDKAKQIILNDGVVAFPTDTVYGLACSAFSPKGIEEIYNLKGRDSKKALIVMIPMGYDITKLVNNITNSAKNLMKDFWPGALTIIFKSNNIIPANATGGLDTIGIRIPDNQIAIDMLNYINIPLCTTSANISGEKSPVTAEEVSYYFDGKLELIIDGGLCDKQLPSTICDLSGSELKILRQGTITEKQISDSIAKD